MLPEGNPLFKITTHTLLRSIENPFYKENRTIKTSWEVRLKLFSGTQFILFTVEESFHKPNTRIGHSRYYLLPFNYVKSDNLLDIGYGSIHEQGAFGQKTTFQASAFRRSNKWESDMGQLQSQLYYNLSMPFGNILTDNTKYKELVELYMDY